MGKTKQYRNAISVFISSDSGQRFFNFAYSIGAAIVIWGALFKILHLPGGNMLLSIGMGTEVLMFILSAFERPAAEYKWERVYPQLASLDSTEESNPATEAPQQGTSSAPAAAVGGGGVVIVGAGMPTSGNIPASQASQATPVTASNPAATLPVDGSMGGYALQLEAMSAEMQQLRESTRRLNEVSETLLQSYRAITDNSENISANSAGYVEQMQTLNRNIQGLNTIYEIQLKSVSSQLDAIDRVNQGIKRISEMYMTTSDNSSRYCEETEKMARNMQQLNKIYEKMLTAMTIQMMPAAMAAPTTTNDNSTPDNN